MNIINWIAAPEGTTHFGPNISHLIANWFKFEKGIWHIWSGNYWSVAVGGLQPLRLETMIQRAPRFGADGLPALESTVRIDRNDKQIWPDAEQFIGADCTLKAVFMTGDTQMVAVEHNEHRVCCCFLASMVRNPEQIEAEEREDAIKDLMQIDDVYHEQAAAIYDRGYRKQVKP